MVHPAVLMSRTPSRRDERGSLIVALSIILILVMIGAAVAFQIVGNQENVVAKANSAASVASADAGLADAVFQLDQLTPSASNLPYCMDANGGSGTLKNAQGNPVTVTCAKAPSSLSGVSYSAVPSNSGTTWTLKASARVSGLAGAVQESVNYTASYPFAIFGNKGLDFNGHNSEGLGTYAEGNSSSSNPDTSAADCSNGVGNSCVSVGSNGPIKCAGNLASNVTEIYYTGGGGSEQGCSNPVANSGKYVLTVPSTPPSSQPCPGKPVTSNGITTYELGPGFGGAPPSVGIAGRTTTYLCSDAAVAISGNLSVLGTVLLYIILDPATDNSFISNGTMTLAVAGGSKVNTTFDGTAGPPPAGTTMPNAESFRVLSNTDGTVGDYNGSGTYTFAGVIYAPNGNLTGNGCKSAYYGSITLSLLTCNGGPHLQVYYDNALKTVYGPPVISGYAQVNPQTVSIP